MGQATHRASPLCDFMQYILVTYLLLFQLCCLTSFTPVVTVTLTIPLYHRVNFFITTHLILKITAACDKQDMLLNDLLSFSLALHLLSLPLSLPPSLSPSLPLFPLYGRSRSCLKLEL